MRTVTRLVVMLMAAAPAFFAQTTERATADTLPTGGLLSEPGPAFQVEDARLAGPLTLITYGDQRFTDPANVGAVDPRVRQWLVQQIAAARPDAVIMNGDVPLAGGVPNDYAVFRTETKPWRDAGLRVFPALGNHEFHGDPRQSLENWWNNFPEMRNRRWYAAQLGSRVYVLALDSDASLLPGSDQARWIEKQIDGLPSSIDFAMVAMHHPPVADVQSTSQSTTTRGQMKSHCATISQRLRPTLTRVFWSARGTSTITNAIYTRA